MRRRRREGGEGGEGEEYDNCHKMSWGVNTCYEQYLFNDTLVK